jgi:AraC-like DNA-binding protein
MGANVAASVSDNLVDWRRAISSAFYPQDVLAESEGPFRANLSVWTLGDISFSRIKSSPVTYRRCSSQIASRIENYHLMTIPLGGDLLFEQQAKQSRCRTRALLAERGDLPYELHQPNANELLVLKVPESLLDARLPRGKTFMGRAISMSGGVVGLFIDLMQSMSANIDAIEPAHYTMLSRQALDLLGIALSAGDHAFESSESSVKDAHFRRIMTAARARLFETRLSPADIADQCGISVRYLHRLFASRGTSLGRWVLEERLAASDEALRRRRKQESIAAIAYRFGFADQAQFCRHYKKRFGRTPSDTRAGARQTDS